MHNVPMRIHLNLGSLTKLIWVDMGLARDQLTRRSYDGEWSFGKRNGRGIYTNSKGEQKACFAGFVCFASFCFALLCLALPCLACFSYLSLPCFASLCFASLCFAVLCFGVLCFALLFFGCTLAWLWLRVGFALLCLRKARSAQQANGSADSEHVYI